MGSEKPPRRKLTARDYVGGFATMLFVFGIIIYAGGGAVPWGYQQCGGLIAGLLGIALMVVRLWLPRSKG